MDEAGAVHRLDRRPHLLVVTTEALGQALGFLSGRGEPEAERGEQAVRETGAELTVLRSTWFMQNLSEDYMLEHVLSGEIRLPAGDVPTPFLDADDIGDVAVAALTDDRHVGRPQCRHHGRCPAGARARAARLRRLCAEHRGDGRLGVGHRPCLNAADALTFSDVIDEALHGQ
jgi:hypothetical protein